MSKKIYLLQMFLFLSFALLAQTPKNFTSFIPTQNFSYSLKTTDNFVFNGSDNPCINLTVINNRKDAMPYKINCVIESEDGVNKYLLSQSSTINSLDSAALSFYFFAPAPGFYKVKLDADGEIINQFNICYNPSKIDFPYYSDKGTDFYWQLLKKKNYLKNPDYKISKIKESRAKPRDAYKVNMKFANGESLNGYLFIPIIDPLNSIARIKLKYGEDVDVDSEKNYWENCIDFVFSVDSVMRPDSLFFVSTIHKYFAVVDFLSTKKETKDKKIFSIGEGFSGGLAIASAVADRRISAVSVYNPYIDDLFINSGSNFKLPRFIKSLDVPILLGMGLQDSIAVPRSLFETYNAIKAPKEYFIYPLNSQEPQKSWDILQNNFLRKF